MNFKKGDTLKLSQTGLDYLYKYRILSFREEASRWRWTFGSYEPKYELVHVRRLDSKSKAYQTYHVSFLELAEG